MFIIILFREHGRFYMVDKCNTTESIDKAKQFQSSTEAREWADKSTVPDYFIAPL